MTTDAVTGGRTRAMSRGDQETLTEQLLSAKAERGLTFAQLVADPAGDRVVVTYDGKFLPYKKW